MKRAIFEADGNTGTLVTLTEQPDGTLHCEVSTPKRPPRKSDGSKRAPLVTTTSFTLTQAEGGAGPGGLSIAACESKLTRFFGHKPPHRHVERRPARRLNLRPTEADMLTLHGEAYFAFEDDFVFATEGDAATTAAPQFQSRRVSAPQKRPDVSRERPTHPL